MANRIKGITVEIGGDTTKLQDALKGVNTEIKNTQSQLRDVNKLLKLDPGNTELISQKHKLLGQSIEETKRKLESLKEAQKQAQQALSEGKISQEQYDALQREIIETENALKSLEQQAGTTNQALQNFGAMGEKLQATGASIESVGNKMMPVSAAVTGIGIAAVKMSSDFDTSMSQVAAVSGATGDEFDALREKAREMGAKTKFSATDAANAMNYMAMSGWKTTDMIAGIDGVMNLAATSGEDLALTSDIVTDALTAFGLKASDSAHFADVLAAASANSNTNVSMMGETFKYAAPIAGALGYSIEDTAEAIGLMANAGIKSSQAGTSLRTIMTELQGELTLAGAGFGEITVQTTNTDGSMRSLNDILGECRVAFSQMTEAEKVANAEALVGKQAMSGFLAIMNAAPEDIEKLSHAITNADGTAEKMATTMQDNLGGQIEELMSALEELAISIGDILMPAVRNVVAGLQGFVDIINNLPEPIKETVVGIGLFVAALGPILVILGKVVGSIGTLMTQTPIIIGTLSKVGTVITGTIIPAITVVVSTIGIVPIAIGAVIAVIVLLWNKCDWFREGLISIWETIRTSTIELWTSFKEFLINLWTELIEGAKVIWQGFTEFFISLWEGIKLVFTTSLTSIGEFVQTGFTAIQNIIQNVMKFIQTIITSVWNGISNFISTIVTGISTFISNAWTNIQNLTQTIWTGISTFVSTIWQTINNTINSILTGIGNFIQTSWTNIQTTITNILNSISQFISTTLTNISTSINTIVTTISTFLSTSWSNIKTNITTVLNNIKTTVNEIWNAIKTTITNLMNQIKSNLSSAWNSVKSTISSTMSAAKSNVSSAFSNMKSNISSAMSNIQTTIKNGFNNAVNHIKNLSSQAATWGSDMVNGIARGIRNAMGNVVGAVKDLASTIRSYLHFSVPDVGPLTDYEEWMPDFMEGLAKGIDQNRYKVRSSIEQVARDMTLSPSLAMANGGYGQTSTVNVGKEIQDALSGLKINTQDTGDIVIPVYLGGTMLDEVIVNASKRSNLRSGGR